MAARQLTKREGQRVYVSTPAYPSAAGVIKSVGVFGVMIKVAIEVDGAVIKTTEAFLHDLGRTAPDPHPDAREAPEVTATPRRRRPRPTTRATTRAPASVPDNVVSIDSRRRRAGVA